MDGPESGEMQGDFGRHAPAVERFALLLTHDHARATDVTQEAIRRARQDQTVSDPDGRTARAWLFTAARDIVGGDRTAAWPDHAHPEEINAAVDRLLLGDALAQLPSDERAVLQTAYYEGHTTAQTAAHLHMAEGVVKSKLHDVLRSLSPQLRDMGVRPS